MEKTGPDSDSEIEAAIRQHPLVRVHGLDPKFLGLQRCTRKWKAVIVWMPGRWC